MKTFLITTACKALGASHLISTAIADASVELESNLAVKLGHDHDVYMAERIAMTDARLAKAQAYIANLKSKSSKPSAFDTAMSNVSESMNDLKGYSKRMNTENFNL